MKPSISRRQLGAALAAVLPAAAQAQQAQQAPTSGESDKAMEQLRNNSKALGEYKLPMSTEPAFTFKP